MVKAFTGRTNDNTIIEIVRRDDRTFDLFIDHKLDQTRTHERWLPEWLCVRFGFCGEEYDEILRRVKESGRATITF